MLIHITPTIYLGRITQPPVCYLSDLTIPELGLKLANEKDIATRHPYPNKHYRVACRKKRKTAMSGILIDSEKTITSFTVESRWVVSWWDKDYPCTLLHRCAYKVLDTEFDAVSDGMFLWRATTGEILGERSSRWPVGYYVEGPPVIAEPRMDVWNHSHGGQMRPSGVCDVIRDGKVMKRSETFYVPTIEPERLSSWVGQSRRVPGLDLAYKI